MTLPCNHWQIEEVTKGVAEAESGDFASDEEVERFLRRWIRQTP